jgi:predicted esterase
MSKKEINILCLHGCNQTKEMFEGLTKQMREIATTYCKNKKCEMIWHFVEAEYDHSLGGKTWYNVELDVPKIGTIEFDHAMANPTLEMIDKVINDLNINVLVGFSQGGNVVDTYLVNKENHIKCAVIFSGYNLVDDNRKVDVETPVMNVYSDSDMIVPSKFMPIYKNMELRAHDKGHKLPTSKPFVREIIDYIFTNCIN